MGSSSQHDIAKTPENSFHSSRSNTPSSHLPVKSSSTSMSTQSRPSFTTPVIPSSILRNSQDHSQDSPVSNQSVHDANLEEPFDPNTNHIQIRRDSNATGDDVFQNDYDVSASTSTVEFGKYSTLTKNDQQSATAIIRTASNNNVTEEDPIRVLKVDYGN